MSRRKRFIPKDIESAKGVGDTSANIYRSMLLHPACKDLTASQFRLYVYCKSELYGKNRHDLDGFPAYVREDPAYFTFNKAKWQKDGLYGLYSNSGQFYRDMDTARGQRACTSSQPDGSCGEQKTSQCRRV